MAKDDLQTSKPTNKLLVFFLKALFVVAALSLVGYLVTDMFKQFDEVGQYVPEPATQERSPADQDKSEQAVSPEPAAKGVPTPDAEAPPKTGQLSVDALPWAEVSMDGVELGRTPLVSKEITPRGYTLVLVNPELGLRLEEKVLIKPDRITHVVVDFSAPSREAKTAWLEVDMAGDWAMVRIDGNVIRATPLLDYRVTAGEHLVELVDGQGEVVKSWKVVVEAGERKILLHEPSLTRSNKTGAE
jgi:hypothetical protein